MHEKGTSVFIFMLYACFVDLEKAVKSAMERDGEGDDDKRNIMSFG